MVSETDIAWLAGLIDGEGCIAVRIGSNREKPNCCISRIEIGMADEETIEEAARLFTEITGKRSCRHTRVVAVKHPIVRRRPQHCVYSCGKHENMKLLRALAPHMRTKRLEALLMLNFLERSTRQRFYKATEFDKMLCRLISKLKTGCGEARAEAEALLGQVIPNQAAEGAARAEGSAEGRESSDLSPNNTDRHEIPASLN